MIESVDNFEESADKIIKQLKMFIFQRTQSYFAGLYR